MGRDGEVKQRQHFYHHGDTRQKPLTKLLSGRNKPTDQDVWDELSQALVLGAHNMQRQDHKLHDDALVDKGKLFLKTKLCKSSRFTIK